MQQVGVVGLGIVGGALRQALVSADVPMVGYDPYLGEGAPEALVDCTLLFLCVPTPPGRGGELDTTAVWKATRDVEAGLRDGTIVAIKSTVPPGTCDALSADFARFEFASVPEFLVATDPLKTLTCPDRVIVGAASVIARQRIGEVMRKVAPVAPILHLSPLQAELTKLAANAFLAAKVSMANELSLVCERFGVNWTDVQGSVGADRRIGPDHITVSPERGFGGECLPKDLDGLIAATTRDGGYEPSLLVAIRDFNEALRERKVSA
jgi:UDPglucose 6-dehydrogenase